jgi:hypothetical protein
LRAVRAECSTVSVDTTTAIDDTVLRITSLSISDGVAKGLVGVDHLMFV